MAPCTKEVILLVFTRYPEVTIKHQDLIWHLHSEKSGDLHEFSINEWGANEQQPLKVKVGSIGPRCYLHDVDFQSAICLGFIH